MSTSSTPEAKLREIASHFVPREQIQEISRYGSGHINDSYKITYLNQGQVKHLLFQRINRHVFPHAEELMQNVMGVCAYLSKKLASLGRDPLRETLTLLPTLDGAPYAKDDQGDLYRVYLFIEDSLSFNLADDAALLYESGKSFGDFAYLLADYPAHELFPTIKDFHNTVKRYETFKQVCEQDPAGRLASVQREVDFFHEHFPLAERLTTAKLNGALPLRVSHNDTKLNNILFDAKTRSGLCVIDLDTVMPGSYVDDFGDSIRFGASTALEDERDLSKVHFDLKLFEAYARGYLETASSILCKEEFESLALASMVMTYECGMRFLTDYIDGDHYFRIAADRPEHNLDRARTQIKLVQDMLAKENEMWATLKSLR